MKIPLKDYAQSHGISPVTARQKAARGGYHTAQKMGRDWFIDENEPHTDLRVKSGQFKNWRKKGENDDGKQV